MPAIVFTAYLTKADWDDTLRAWRCPPLAVPGAIVEALYSEGSRIDSARYEVLNSQAVIRWIPSDQPEKAAAAIKLTQELTLASETDRWKKLAIMWPVAATILSATISGVATYYSKPGSDGQSSIHASITANAANPLPGEARSSKVASSKQDLDEPSSGRASNAAKGFTAPPDGEKDFAPATDNTHITRAKVLTLGQTEKGTATQEPHWFKFSTSSRSSTRLHVLIRNPALDNNCFEAQAYGPDELEIDRVAESGRNGVLEFPASISGPYYLMIRKCTEKGPSYELVVTEK